MFREFEYKLQFQKQFFDILQFLFDHKVIHIVLSNNGYDHSVWLRSLSCLLSFMDLAVGRTKKN